MIVSWRWKLCIPMLNWLCSTLVKVVDSFQILYYKDHMYREKYPGMHVHEDHEMLYGQMQAMGPDGPCRNPERIRTQISQTKSLFDPRPSSCANIPSPAPIPSHSNLMPIHQLVFTFPSSPTQPPRAASLFSSPSLPLPNSHYHPPNPP